MLFAALFLLAPGAGRGTAAEFRDEVSRTFDRTLTISSAATLRVEHRHGHVRVRGHAGDDLRIRALIRVSGDSGSEAQAFADRIEIDIAETSSSVVVRTRYPPRPESGGLFAFLSWRRELSYAVDYDILVPDRMPIDVRNSFGEVSVVDSKADATIVNAHGRVSIRDSAGRYRVENSFGPAEVSNLTGNLTIATANGSAWASRIAGNVNLTNRFGEIRAIDIGGDAIIGNRNGNVRASGITGRADVSSSFGAIDVRGVGKDLRVDAANGSVIVADVRGGADVATRFGQIDARTIASGLQVTSRNGNVRVIDVEGPLIVRAAFGTVTADRLRGTVTIENTNGNVHASGITGAARVTTSFGGIVLKDVEGRVDALNRNGAIDVAQVAKGGTCHDAILTTSFGPIQIRLPDGGYTVNAETAHGQIRTNVPMTSTGTLGERRISGRIGNGACRLQLANRNGDIMIGR